ncbi:hypothetical protein B0H13DRAFT_1890135 [Mycena leptocephala]|nr:hypothetical protein B0H13DRAFT_1890135 [Mycena leptocephala]
MCSVGIWLNSVWITTRTKKTARQWPSGASNVAVPFAEFNAARSCNPSQSQILACIGPSGPNFVIKYPKYAQSLAKTLQTTSNKSRTGKTISVKSRGNFAFSDIIITSTRLEKEEMRDLSEKLEKLAGPGESTDNRSQRAGHAGTTVDKLQILQTGNGTYQQYHGTNHQASGKSKMLEYTAILAENTKAFVANNYHKPTASKPAELNSQTVHFHKRSTPEEIESDIETVFDDITVLKIYGSSILEVQVIAGKALKEKPSKKKTYLMKSASIFGGILLPVGSKVE